jgi:hypothetical protein
MGGRQPVMRAIRGVLACEKSRHFNNVGFKQLVMTLYWSQMAFSSDSERR